MSIFYKIGALLDFELTFRTKHFVYSFEFTDEAIWFTIKLFKFYFEIYLPDCYRKNIEISYNDYFIFKLERAPEDNTGLQSITLFNKEIPCKIL
jgi:hypothetical protein